jgi:hypothetical protein
MSLGPRATIALLVIVNLLAGGVGAVAIDRSLFPADAPRPCQKGQFFALLRRELALDDEQTEKVRAILDARRPECQRIMTESRDRIDAFHAETDAELAKVLRPDQVARLAQIRRQRDREHHN